MSDLSSASQETILFIRSGTIDHSRKLLLEARERSRAAGNSRWIMILQPGVEKEFDEFIRETGAGVLRYDKPVFTFDDLKTLFGGRLSTETFSEAYVPFNNPDGPGYFHILRFLAFLYLCKSIFLRLKNRLRAAQNA